MPRQILVLCTTALVAGCAGYPQNPDEFISTYHWGGRFQNVERTTIDRPAGAVVADVRQYARKCLDIKTYNTQVAVIKNGATALAVQETGNAEQSGLPAGGMFTLVAEIRAAGRTRTEVNIYHLSKAFMADPLKRWIEGGKRECPAL